MKNYFILFLFPKNFQFYKIELTKKSNESFDIDRIAMLSVRLVKIGVF